MKLNSLYRQIYSFQNILCNLDHQLFMLSKNHKLRCDHFIIISLPATAENQSIIVGNGLITSCWALAYPAMV